MKTAMQLLFKEFEALSKASRDAKDLQTANLIDFLCERKQVALEKEKKQIIDAYEWGLIDGEKEAKREQKYDHSGSSFYDDFYNQNK